MASSNRTAQYFAALLWATAGLSVIRFIGCLYFLFKTGALRLVRRR
jgi:chitin synthase